jgi:2-polyprenyl-3-methyl-5-hydroxy-6-metoxy-1,4-benzoquinol methylase
MEQREIHQAVITRYARVARQPEGQFPYPVGRQSLEILGYEVEMIDGINQAALRHYVGIGNPFSLGQPTAGGCVLDIGCGAGVDALIAARYTGAGGQVIGMDMSPDMLRVATTHLTESGAHAARVLRYRLPVINKKCRVNDRMIHAWRLMTGE